MHVRPERPPHFVLQRKGIARLRVIQRAVGQASVLPSRAPPRRSSPPWEGWETSPRARWVERRQPARVTVTYLGSEVLRQPQGVPVQLENAHRLHDAGVHLDPSPSGGHYRRSSRRSADILGLRFDQLIMIAITSKKKKKTKQRSDLIDSRVGEDGACGGGRTDADGRGVGREDRSRGCAVRRAHGMQGEGSGRS